MYGIEVNVNKLLLDEHPLIILPNLACRVGLEEAVILQQVHYWLNKSNHLINERKWVYKTYEEWHAEFPFWSIPTIRRKITGLEKDKILITANFNKMLIDRTKWYSIDYRNLSRYDKRVKE